MEPLSNHLTATNTNTHRYQRPSRITFPGAAHRLPQFSTREGDPRNLGLVAFVISDASCMSFRDMVF